MLPRLMGITHKPQLQFRFDITAYATGMATFQLYAKGSTLPTLEHNTQEVDALGYSLKLKGKTRYPPIQITCYAFENITYNELFAWLAMHTPKEGSGTDLVKQVYAHDMTITLYGPDGSTPKAKWKLIDAQIESIQYGNVDWSVSEVVMPTLSIAYDYFQYTPI